MLVASTMSNLVVVESETTCNVGALRLKPQKAMGGSFVAHNAGIKLPTMNSLGEIASIDTRC